MSEGQVDVPHGTSGSILAETAAIAALDVSHETLLRLQAFVDLLRHENEHQNLVSRDSLQQVWARHILDSAQLLRFVPADADAWLDLGTGAGFPGLVVAALHPARFTLVESRKLRGDFLRRSAETLCVAERVEVFCGRLETLETRPVSVISARAFAPLEKLLGVAERFSTPETIWVLPKGRNAKSELDAALASWQGEFRLEPSRTDADAWIIVAKGVRRTAKGKRAR
jgi:16S rRNA (guanine527-N7)-methyltransferase